MKRLSVFVSCVAGIFLLTVSPPTATAEWRIDIGSAVVSPNQTGITIDVTTYWDIALAGFSLPVVARTVQGTTFWTGSLPYDTGGNAFSHPHVNGVVWNWSNQWAVLAEEMRPGLPSAPCSADGDLGYDGNSPDHFAFTAGGVASTPAEPTGRVIISFTFDINAGPGVMEFDTACFTSSLNSIFLIDEVFPPVDHGPLGTGECVFNKGTISIPTGNHTIAIESKTVATSSSGVQLGISFANDDPLQRITLPLICRNLTGNAFWANVPTSLDTLPWTGRMTSALTFGRSILKSQVDGLSPDPFVVEAFNDTEPALAPGALEKMITLVFDVGDDGGTFEIDTAFFAPALGLEVETPGNPGVVITPEFIKGIITAVPPDTGNRVEIGSGTFQGGTPDVVIPITVNAGYPLWSIQIPLVARTVTGSAFWHPDVDTLSWTTTPAIAVSSNRNFSKFGNFDHVSPDNFLIWAKADFGIDPCLTSAEIPLQFSIKNEGGTFEIDTALYPPLWSLRFLLCDEIAAVIPQFTKGIITVNPCDCSMNGDWDCDGGVNPVDVVLCVNYVYRTGQGPCNPGNCFQNGDLNCDKAINVVDVVWIANLVYRPGAPQPCDPCTIYP